MTLIGLIYLIFMNILPEKIIKICVYQANLRPIFYLRTQVKYAFALSTLIVNAFEVVVRL